MRKCMILLLLALPLQVASADTFNIEIDYMVDTDHTHKPTLAMLNAVIQVFACQGHTLNIDLDDEIPHRDVLIRDPDDCGIFFGYDNNNWNSFGQIRQSYFNHAGQAGWFYGVFAHQYENNSCVTTGSSGLSNGGVYFIVTMGSFSGQQGTAFDNAATLAHEFGHNLGLSHCGTQYCGSNTGAADYVGPYVPNMPSTMAYRYQLRGVETSVECNALAPDEALFKEIDYSHGLMCQVDEDDLDERAGSYMSEVDWDCDGTIEASVAQDINGDGNGWCGATGNRTTVSDYNEWANLSPGARIAEAADSGDVNLLKSAGFRFLDSGDPATVRQAARDILASLPQRDLWNLPAIQEAAETGDKDVLEKARFLFVDPDDRQAVKRVARDILENRRIEFDTAPCITAEQWEEMQNETVRGAVCPQPALATESCFAGDNVYVGTLFCIPVPPVCFDFGTCTFEHGSVLTAHNAHPSGSVFFLAPGTYDETNSLVLNRAGKYFCERTDGTGSAVIK